MRNIRTAVAILGAAMSFILIPYYFDYSDFSWEENASNYIGFITGVLVVIVGLWSNYIDSNRQKKFDN
jgi:hypothetical protein